MAVTPWSERVRAAVEHLAKGGRVYPAALSLAVIDEVVNGVLSRTAIADKYGCQLDLIDTAVGHVTTAIHGPGRVPSLADGGWYESGAGAYAVAARFAAAWKEHRAAGAA